MMVHTHTCSFFRHLGAPRNVSIYQAGAHDCINKCIVIVHPWKFLQSIPTLMIKKKNPTFSYVLSDLGVIPVWTK